MKFLFERRDHEISEVSIVQTSGKISTALYTRMGFNIKRELVNKYVYG